MAWKTINGKRYYYRYAYEGGRTVEKYVGPGEIGERAAADVAARLAAQKAQKEARQAEWERITADLAEFNRLRLEASANVRAGLEAAGYHQHARGVWRRKRGGRQVRD